MTLRSDPNLPTALWMEKLARANCFALLPEEVLCDISRLVILHNVEDGGFVLRHNEPSKDLYIILEGAVRVYLVGASGRELTYQLLDSGEMFGELSAIDGAERSTSIVAEGRVQLISLKRVDVRKLMEQHSAFSIAVAERLARLSRRLISRLYEYHTYNVKGRVIAELLRIHDEEEKGAITDRDMASRVGTTRENVTRLHSQLRNSGVIAREDGRIVVLDRTKLEEMLADCEFS